MSKLENKIRIIGGKFKGRKLSFPTIKGLRPTPNRLRETLFNWLMNDIHGANCLDLFAGSGALGFEALSRGASKVTFVDQSPEVIRQLHENQELLKRENVSIMQGNSAEFLRTCKEKYDIIFLDPPFESNLLKESLGLIKENNLLTNQGVIYIEAPKQFDLKPLLNDIQTWKETKTGDVNALLAKRASDNSV